MLSMEIPWGCCIRFPECPDRAKKINVIINGFFQFDIQFFCSRYACANLAV